MAVLAQQQMGDAGLRAENINKAVKGFALKQFKMKQVLQVQSSSSWEETFYKEAAAELSAQGSRNVRGIARGAAFPKVSASWTKTTGTMLKWAAEDIVFMEDKLLNNIDVQARTILRVARSLADDMDNYIYDQLSAASGIGTSAAVANWDDTTISSRDPIQDILKGIQDMDEQNYDALENGYLLVSPKDHTSLMMNSKVINNPSFKTADVVSNGRVGQICGLTIIKSTSVNEDEAMIIIGQRAATWKSAVPITSAVIEDQGIKFTIRSWEIGLIQITDPRAIYVITDTQK